MKHNMIGQRKIQFEQKEYTEKMSLICVQRTEEQMRSRNKGKRKAEQERMRYNTGQKRKNRKQAVTGVSSVYVSTLTPTPPCLHQRTSIAAAG